MLVKLHPSLLVMVEMVPPESVKLPGHVVVMIRRSPVKGAWIIIVPGVAHERKLSWMIFATWIAVGAVALLLATFMATLTELKQSPEVFSPVAVIEGVTEA